MFGYDKSIVNTWQQITIPSSALNLGNSTYQKIRIKNSTLSYSFFLDLVEIQDGNSGTANTSTDTSVNTSQSYYSTTQYGAIDDADISLGSTSFGTDNTTILQQLLDEALTKPITIIWDGKHSTQGLTINSNTTIIGINGCGVILRNSSNSPVFVNSNRVLPSSTGGYGSNIVDENIIIKDLIINGNGYNDAVGGNDVFDVANNGSAVNGSAQTKRIPIIDFLGAREVYINNVKLLGGRYWATSFCNVQQVHINNLDIDFGDSSSRDDANYDGLHFNGYARWISCDGLRLKGTKDDCLALNADANPILYPSYQGDILDATFNNINFNNSVRGIRIQSATSRVDRISFSNIFGETTDAICLIETLWGTDYGNIGSIYFDNINVILTDDSYYFADAYFYISSQTLDSLVIKNFTRNDFTYDAPLVYVANSNVEIKNIDIDGVYMHSTGGTYASPLIEVIAGDVKNINISNLTHRESTGKINADIIKQSGGTIESISLSNLQLNNIGKILNNTAGTLNRIKGVNIQHLGTVDIPFTSATTITDLGLSNFNTDNDSLTSGVYTNKFGDGFIYKPSTKVLMPSATQYLSCYLVTDEDGGVPAYSDGVDWRRTYDKTIIATGLSIPTGNLVTYLRFNNDVTDETANHTPTSNGVAYVNGLYSAAANEAIEFNAAADWVKIADDDTFSFGNGTTDVPFSISFGINGDNFGTLTTTRNKILLAKKKRNCWCE